MAVALRVNRNDRNLKGYQNKKLSCKILLNKHKSSEERKNEYQKNFKLLLVAYFLGRTQC